MSRQPFFFFCLLPTTTYALEMRRLRRLGQTRPLRNTPTNGSNGERGKEGAASFPLSEWDSGDATGENKVCLAGLAVGEITPVTYICHSGCCHKAH
jgi:hypothetical protein